MHSAPPLTRAAIGLGANLGEPRATLAAACEALAALPHSRWVAGSSLYCSRPVQATGPDFFNGVALLDTTLPPLSLLDALQAIEQAHHRQRSYRNAPRTLDLDLLLYGAQTIVTDRLCVPHPRLAERAFVLMPLLELMPDLALPGVADATARAHELAALQGIVRLDDPLAAWAQ
jgi:2-amino-4-hydroxy-6-hydroxymethyldihydropteridine diphosphokinase